MPPFHLIDPARLIVELAYTFIVVFLCFTIYFKTREMYELTKHEGIKYFRSTFLFFGLAYLFRLLSVSIILMDITFDLHSSMRIFRFIPMVFIGYFSTMAIISLTYSIIRKELNFKHMFLLSNAVAILISGIAFISRAQYLLTLAQAILLVFTIVMAYYYHYKSCLL